mmetsp:Transcript_119414/g.363313  ORF Transcript_119414/g.363313 Transcript_119414/m.363313 type:complete len:518 (-) Transcript_119414:183-1736(-)
MAAIESTFLTSLNADRKRALSRQQKREELLAPMDSGQQILQLHSDLQSLADDLDEKVESKLNANENAFFLAYHSFMYTVQKELKELKQKADEEEHFRKLNEHLAKSESLNAAVGKEVPSHILDDALLGDDDAEPPLGIGEVIERLREMGQPITLFGETDMQRYRRLRSDEKDAHEGKKNPDVVMLESLHQTQQLQMLQNDEAEQAADAEEEEAAAASERGPAAGAGPHGRSGSLAGPPAQVAAVSTRSAAVALSELRMRYDRDGFVFPLCGLSGGQVAEALAGFKRFEEQHWSRVDDGGATIMNHTWLPWLRDLAKHTAIVRAVCQALRTENVLLYNSQLLTRPPGTSQRTHMGVGWHIDADPLYSRLAPMDRRHWVTAFVALTVCYRQQGCLQAKRTGRCGKVDDEEEVVDLELLPGEFSLHGPSTPHTGGLNTSEQTRYCVALRYIRASTRDDYAEVLGKDMALLVSGKDRYQHFEAMPELPGEATEEGRILREGIMQHRRMGPSSCARHGMVCA